MVNKNRVQSAKNADSNNGIHLGKYAQTQRVAIPIHHNSHGDIWRAIVASGSKGLVIPLWWLMAGGTNVQ